jgi:hypothetical protein
MAQRSKYWSCTPFASWLRGTPKPSAATSEDWSIWRKTASVAHPIRYWLAEEGLDAVQNFLWWPVDKIYDLKYYINNRWVTSTHALTAHSKDIKRGRWCDLGNRFLPCLFNELVDFVEVEQAWFCIAWDVEARKKYDAPRWSWGWFRWRTWRCPQAGIDCLTWASNLTNEEFLDEDKKHLAEPTPQALAAKEILSLYRWWKEEYPLRLDPHDASGWSEYCRAKREESDDGSLTFETKTDEERQEVSRMLDIMRKIEEEYEDQDTEMMIRLIKVRSHLWT